MEVFSHADLGSHAESGALHARPFLGIGQNYCAGKPELRLSPLTRLHGAEIVNDPLALSNNIYTPDFEAARLREVLGRTGAEHRLISHPFDGTEISIGDLLEVVEHNPPQRMDILGLDYFSAQHPVPARILHDILMHGDQDALANAFGPECITWILANLSAEKTQQGKENTLGRNFQLQRFFSGREVDMICIEKALRTIRHWIDARSSTRAHTLAINYNLLRCHDPDSPLFAPHVDIMGIIGESSMHVSPGDPDERERGGCFPVKRLKEYSLKALRAEGKRDYGCSDRWRGEVMQLPDGSMRYYPNYIDATIGFALCWRGIPQAIMSGIVTDPRTFFIVQLHGVRGYQIDSSGRRTRCHARGLIGLRTELVLEMIAEKYARFFGLTRLGLLGASNNMYLGSKKNPERVFKYEHARKRYDGIAEREGSGWEYNPEDQNFYRPVL